MEPIVKEILEALNRLNEKYLEFEDMGDNRFVVKLEINEELGWETFFNFDVCGDTIRFEVKHLFGILDRVQDNEYADILLTLFPIIRLYDATKMMLGGYNNALQAWECQTVHVERTRARLLSMSALLSTIPLMLLFWVGGGMAIDGTITVGTLYVFLNLSGNLSGVMMNMPSYIASFRQFSVNMKRLSPNIFLDERGQ